MPRRSARHKRRSSNQHYKKYFALIGLFLFFLLFLSFYAFYKQFHQSYTQARSLTSENFQDQDFYTIALISSAGSFESQPLEFSSVKLLFLSPGQNSFVVYEIPPDLEIDIPGKFGYEKISSLFTLGTLDLMEGDGCSESCISGGLEFSVDSLENFIGIKIDRFVFIDPSLVEFSENLLINGKISNIFNKEYVSSLKASLLTNMKFTDFLTFYYLIRGYSQDDVEFKSFTNNDEMDSALRQLTFDSNCALEKKSVAVLNAAGTPGLASFGARVVKNRGGHVVAVENASRNSDKTYLIASESDSSLVRYLSSFFEISEVYSKEELNFTDAVLDRADITLILGIDNAGKY